MYRHLLLTSTVTADTRPEELSVSDMLANEETILRSFPKQTALVIAALERVRKIVDSCNIQPDDLFGNSLCSTLYKHIRPAYPVNTLAGKKARGLLKDLQQICLTDKICPRNLPEVSDCDSPPSKAPSTAPDLLTLFTGDSRGRVLSDDPTTGSPPLHSTVVQPRRNLPRYMRIVLFRVVNDFYLIRSEVFTSETPSVTHGSRSTVIGTGITSPTMI